MKILQRYILKEHVGPLIFSLSAFTALLLLNQVAKRFGDLVGKGLSWGVIGEFFALSIPFIVAMTLPMSVLVATLYAFSRLAAENEITALKASGVGIWKVIRPVLWGAAGVALVMLYFNDQILPRANHRLRVLQSDIGRKKPTFALREQVINELSPGRLFMKAGHVDNATSKMREITIYDFGDQAHRRTVYADSGMMALAPNQQDLEMTLYHGYSQEIPRENPTEMQRLYYVVDRIRVRGVANKFENDTTDTYKSDREMSICEMQTEYLKGSQEFANARHDLEEALASLAQQAATGAPRAATKAPALRRSLSLAGSYCRWVQPLFAVTSAEAAELPPQAPQSQARQDTAARRAAPPSPVARAPQGAQQGARQRAQPTAQQPTRLPPSAGGSTTFGRPQPLPVIPGMPRSLRERLHLARDSAGAPVHPPLLPQGAAGAAVLGAPIAGGYRAPVIPGMPQISAQIAQMDVYRARLTDARSTNSRYQVEIHKKFALAAACIVFVLLGAPIALRFPRGGVGLVIGVSLTVFALYYVGLIMGETLADKLILAPFWAMWLANIVFTLVGLYFLYLIRNSGSTARGGDFSELLDSLKAWVAQRFRRAPAPVPAGHQVATGD